MNPRSSCTMWVTRVCDKPSVRDSRVNRRSVPSTTGSRITCGSTVACGIDRTGWAATASWAEEEAHHTAIAITAAPAAHRAQYLASCDAALDTTRIPVRESAYGAPGSDELLPLSRVSRI